MKCMTIQRLFSTNQAAEYLGTTPFTLKTSRCTGLLWGQPAPEFIKLKRAVRYRKETLDEWLVSLPEEQKNTAQ